MPSATTHEVTVLLIEDEAEIRRFLRATLPPYGYRLYEATSGAEGLAQASARNPDMILLDLGLPDMNGSAVIGKIRAWSNLPIIVLSARDQEHVKVEAFDLGADDYVTKPFGVEELLARMRAALRHAHRPEGSAVETVCTFGTLSVDVGRRQVFVSGTEIHLTPIEYKLLTTLVRYAGKVVTHRQLLKEVWGPLHVEEGHYLRVYMRQLRNKIEANPAQPRHLVTELGVGYRLRVE
ncbi:MAG: DNA-binding response regulator KdpE [Nitrospira sp.]|jgi:two-component system KDP operon response regulator KdpE|nr:MAG: DNA-binding response regulator KdpE [Nitrospira sp.]